MPLGALVGGVLLDVLGNRPSLWLTTVALAMTVAVLVPLWRLPD